MYPKVSDSDQKAIVSSPLAVLHGNNLLVFGGTGIPFGENNGNDVHVCNVQYKRWNLLNCRGKKPNRIYGQVKDSIASALCNVWDKDVISHVETNIYENSLY